jgi:hypothetical protein
MLAFFQGRHHVASRASEVCEHTCDATLTVSTLLRIACLDGAGCSRVEAVLLILSPALSTTAPMIAEKTAAAYCFFNFVQHRTDNEDDGSDFIDVSHTVDVGTASKIVISQPLQLHRLL